MPIVLETSLTTNYISFFNASACNVKINEDGNEKYAQPIFGGGFFIFVAFWRKFGTVSEKLAPFFPACLFIWALT
jgi:hypothetical protein